MIPFDASRKAKERERKPKLTNHYTHRQITRSELQWAINTALLAHTSNPGHINLTNNTITPRLYQRQTYEGTLSTMACLRAKGDFPLQTPFTQIISIDFQNPASSLFDLCISSFSAYEHWKLKTVKKCFTAIRTMIDKKHNKAAEWHRMLTLEKVFKALVTMTVSRKQLLNDHLAMRKGKMLASAWIKVDGIQFF